MTTEYRKVMRLDERTFNRVICKFEPRGAGINEEVWLCADRQTLKDATADALQSQTTILQESLGATPLSFTSCDFTVFLPSSTDEIVVAVLGDDGMELVLYPKRGGVLERGIIPIPIFEVEYKMDEIPGSTPINAIVDGALRARNAFEGDLLFDTLGKALRPQKNRVEGEVSCDSVSEALSMIEKDGHIPRLSLFNTNAFSKIRTEVNPDTGLLFNTSTRTFDPRSRGQKKRNYFLAEPESIGVLAISPPTIEPGGTPDGTIVTLSCVYKMGVVIFDRGLVSAVDSSRQ